MRIDGFSSSSYPVKRKPRKGIARADESVDDVDGEVDAGTQIAARPRASGSNVSSLPARQQDGIFERGMSRSAATALASYLSTASFVDWDLEVLGLDVHI